MLRANSVRLNHMVRMFRKMTLGDFTRLVLHLSLDRVGNAFSSRHNYTFAQPTQPHYWRRFERQMDNCGVAQ